jgi:heme/copper-type cytochrome/quinol oxidase subunit 2
VYGCPPPLKADVRNEKQMKIEAIFAILLFVLFLCIPFAFMARMICSAFSKESRKKIIQHKAMHIIWFIVSLIIFVLVFIIPVEN